MSEFPIDDSLTIHDLFISSNVSKPATKVSELTTAGRIMLETWKSSYMATRAKIEEIGKATRWEFDKVLLFAETDYQAQVCKDLNEVATVNHTLIRVTRKKNNFLFR